MGNALRRIRLIARGRKEVKKTAARMEVDRLGDLPEALKVRILGCLNPKHAVQTSIFSRTWVSLWTWIPVVELNYLDFGFDCDFDKLCMFDKFVNNVLCGRDHMAKLDRLKFFHPYACSVEILNSVFDYAFSHGVKELEASIQRVHGEDPSWPVSVCDSLTNLKLQTECGRIRCPFLEPGSTLFKNLAVLHLEGARITDVEPFSGFPMLESLTLNLCVFRNESKILRVHAIRLSDLTIKGLGSSKNRIKCELRTPRLRFLKYEGPFFSIDHDQGLSVLETLDIDSYGFIYSSGQGQEREKRLFDVMLSLFCNLRSVKSLTLSSIILHVLFLFPEELARRCSPFWELKDLKLDLRDHYCNGDWLQSPSRESFESVKAYLLRNSPDAKFTVTKPKSLECMVSTICYEHRNL